MNSAYEKRMSALERDVEYILVRLGQLMLRSPELAEEIGFATGATPRCKGKCAKCACRDRK